MFLINELFYSNGLIEEPFDGTEKVILLNRELTDLIDSNLLEDITNEREVMDNVYNFLREHGTTIRAWYYGHYHEHNTQEYDGVRFYMLDMSRYGKFDMVEVKN